MADTQDTPVVASDFKPAYPGLKPGRPTIQQFLAKSYNNPKYKALSPDNKKRFDNETYDKFVLPYYQKIAKKDAPNKNDWLKLSPEQRVGLRDQITPKEMGDLAAAATFRVLKGGTTLYQHINDFLFPQAGKVVHEQTQRTIEADQKAAEYYDKQSHLEQSVTKKIIDKGEEHLPDLALFHGVGKAVGMGADLLEGGNIMKAIASNPVGRYAIKSIVGAADGYLTGAGIEGTQKGAGEWAVFGGIANPAFHYIGTVLGMAGEKFFKSSLADTAAKLEMPEPIHGQIVNIQDPLVRKLTVANAKLLNDTARDMFPKKGGYNVLAQEEKDKVLGSIYNSVGRVLEHPLAYSEATSLHAIESKNAELIKEPEVKAAVQQIRATTKKLTGEAEFKGAAKRETERAQGEVEVSREPVKKKGKVTFTQAIPKSASADAPRSVLKDAGITPDKISQGIRYITDPNINNYSPAIKLMRATFIGGAEDAKQMVEREAGKTLANWRSYKLGDNTAGEMFDSFQVLKSHIEKSPAQDLGTLYRGVSGDLKNYDRLKLGDTVSFPIASFSKNSETAKIHTKQGEKNYIFKLVGNVKGVDTSTVSHLPGEQEVFVTGKYKVQSVEDKAGVKIINLVEDTSNKITSADAPGAAKKYSPAFTQQTFMKYLSLGMPIEKEEDRAVLRYWQATNGRIPDKKLAQKVIDAYETENPSPNFRAAREQGLTEHMEKLLRTQHITPGGDKRGVFRSGEYGTGKTKTDWQTQLDVEDALRTATGKERKHLLSMLKDLKDEE